MRLVLVAATALGAAAPAIACPPREACLVNLPSTVRENPPPPTTQAITRVLQLPVAREAPPPGEVEMPWIWRALREQVYARMPRYRDRDELTIVLAPVVVTSPSDTVPGVGISGDF